MVDRQDHLRPVPPDRRRQVRAQTETLDDGAVGQPEELDLVHTDRGTTLDLFPSTQRSGLTRGHRGDADLAVGDEDVGDLLALPGPAGHGGSGSVLHVVGMGDDRQAAMPVLGKDLQR